MKPQSPTRLVMKAFLPAVAADSRSCQNEMRKYEQVPTPSHPTNVITMLPPRTRRVIEATNRFMYMKNLGNRGSPFM